MPDWLGPRLQSTCKYEFLQAERLSSASVLAAAVLWSMDAEPRPRSPAFSTPITSRLQVSAPAPLKLAPRVAPWKLLMMTMTKTKWRCVRNLRHRSVPCYCGALYWNAIHLRSASTCADIVVLHDANSLSAPLYFIFCACPMCIVSWPWAWDAQIHDSSHQI